MATVAGGTASGTTRGAIDGRPCNAPRDHESVEGQGQEDNRAPDRAGVMVVVMGATSTAAARRLGGRAPCSKLAEEDEGHEHPGREVEESDLPREQRPQRAGDGTGGQVAEPLHGGEQPEGGAP